MTDIRYSLLRAATLRAIDDGVPGTTEQVQAIDAAMARNAMTVKPPRIVATRRLSRRRGAILARRVA